MLIILSLFVAILAFWFIKSPRKKPNKNRILAINFLGFAGITSLIIASAFLIDFSAIGHENSGFLQSIAGQISFSKDIASSLGNDLLEATLLIGLWLLAITIQAVGFMAFAIWDLSKVHRRTFA